MSLFFIRSAKGAAAALAGFCALGAQLRAEPVVDRALSGLRQINRPGCSILKIDFNIRIRYDSHFPIDLGSELRIKVRPIDPAQAAALSLLTREALRAPDSKTVAIKSIEFETNEPGGPVLRILFERPASYKVAPGADFQSIIIAISGPKPSVACKPEVAARNESWNASVTRDDLTMEQGTAPKVHVPPPGEASPAQVQQAAAWMDEARAAIKKGSFAEASRTLGKVLSLPGNPSSADAQELMGVARQKGGQLAAARAEYEEFLRRYPEGEAAGRVRQRLDGIMTAQGEDTAKLRPSKTKETFAGTNWTVSGSASSFYIRNDSFRTLRDPSLPPDLNATKDDHQAHQNTLLSTFDTIAAWNTPEMKAKFRFSGTEEHSFVSNVRDEDIIAVAALSLETTFRELDLTTRLGRQTRNTGGVLGRFDGAVATWQANPFMRVNAVIGSPVERRKDQPFKDEKLFYGASLDFGPFDGWETSVFAIEQRDRSELDRQAIGAEFRYLRPDRSLFGTVDYDVHFGELNAAILSGSWTFWDKSTLYGSADYRKSPYLSAWTALQGQPFTTLYQLLKAKTKDEVDQLAIDRTSSYKSASLGYSYPITEKLQWSTDATVTDTSGTPESGGVDASLAPGTDLYASTQLIGTNVFTEGDTYVGALRYAHNRTSNLYVLDVSARYPVSNELKVSPRLRLGYRLGDGTDLEEISVLPSVLFNYYWTRDLNFELEAGTNWTQLDQNHTRETTTDLFVTAGVRYDFYADGRTPAKCERPGPSCP